MMSARHRRLGWPIGLRWPRRTARLRFTAVYSGLFLLSGAALIATTYLLFQQATHYTAPDLPQIPRTPDIQALQLPPKPALPQALVEVAKDQYQLAQAQQQLTPPDQSQLVNYVNCMRNHGVPNYPYPTGGSTNFNGTGVDPASPSVESVSQLCGQKLNLPAWWIAGTGPLGQSQSVGAYAASQLTQAQQQLTQDQHQLSQAVNQLAAAVHLVSQAGAVQVAQRASDSRQLLINSGFALALMAVLALLLGWLVAGRILRPIRAITTTARRISASNLRERLALRRADEEFKRLGDTLDDLFTRLEASFESQRHFVANASHELRTPLTAERSLLQVALDDPHSSAQTWRDTANELLASNDEQRHLIEALLTLASSECELDRRERTDLVGICETVLARPGFDPDSLGLNLEAEAIRPAPFDGDPRLVERLVANLVDNAVGHNNLGGYVRITTDTTDGKAVLSVTNSGPIIPDGQIDRLFQPFQRLDPHRTHHKDGHGLGLSIVRAIATTHHATIDTHPQPEGGLSVTVTFPRCLLDQHDNTDSATRGQSPLAVSTAAEI